MLANNIKKLFLIFASIFLLSSCKDAKMARYTPDEQFAEQNLEHWSKLESFMLNSEPVIRGFNGEKFGSKKDITANGSYTGFSELNQYSNMIYCNDNGSVIWRENREKYSMYRLDSRGRKEKICPYEECRNDIESVCGHTPIYELTYSDGFLYFAIGGSNMIAGKTTSIGGSDDMIDIGKKKSSCVFIYKYDVDRHEYEKLMELQGVEYCNLALNGRYLYARTYNWEESAHSTVLHPDYYKADFTITRIDLFTDTAVMVYSDLKNPDDFDKIGELRDFEFADDKVIMPVINENKIFDTELQQLRAVRTGSSINICTIDMMNFETLIELENERIWGKIYLYGEEIYFASAEKGLSRIDINTGIREILNAEITNFRIEGDFLYYALDEVYRIELDYTRELNFDKDSILTYRLEKGYYLNDWDVCGGYLYADLQTEYEIRISEGELPNTGYYRIRLKLSEEPYLLYKN